MKTKLFAGMTILGLLILAGCGSAAQQAQTSEALTAEPLPVQTLAHAPQGTPEPSPQVETEPQVAGEQAEANPAQDPLEQIRAQVEAAAMAASGLQDELSRAEAMGNALPAGESSEQQDASETLLALWEAECALLESRLAACADSPSKGAALEQQENWAQMRKEASEEAACAQAGDADGETVSEILAQFTRNRAYVLAAALAGETGESFVLPEKSRTYGFFADNQGTGSIYSFLVTRRGASGEDEAVISLFRLAELTGTFVDNGNGELAFTSKELGDGTTVKGVLKLNGWDGAVFTVTEASAYDLHAGEEFEFPFAF